jgi:hypothetical protein
MITNIGLFWENGWNGYSQTLGLPCQESLPLLWMVKLGKHVSQKVYRLQNSRARQLLQLEPKGSSDMSQGLLGWVLLIYFTQPKETHANVLHAITFHFSKDLI